METVRRTNKMLLVKIQMMNNFTRKQNSQTYVTKCIEKQVVAKSSKTIIIVSKIWYKPDRRVRRQVILTDIKDLYISSNVHNIF